MKYGDGQEAHDAQCHQLQIAERWRHTFSFHRAAKELITKTTLPHRGKGVTDFRSRYCLNFSSLREMCGLTLKIPTTF